MADPRAGIFASVARRQAGVDPRPGDAYLRDGEPLIVRSRDGERLSWRTASGEDLSGTLADFRSRAVDPLDLSGEPGSFLDHAWQLASSTGVPRDVRAVALGRAARRASGQDALTVREWAGILASGREPRRKP